MACLANIVSHEQDDACLLRAQRDQLLVSPYSIVFVNNATPPCKRFAISDITSQQYFQVCVSFRQLDAVAARCRDRDDLHAGGGRRDGRWHPLR
jgi:hypothetical protein